MTASDKLARAEAMDLMRESTRMKAALQDIAEAEAIPNDALAFVWCRNVARAALNTDRSG